MQVRAIALLFACGSVLPLGCSAKVQDAPASAGEVLPNRRDAATQADFDRAETATRAAYTESVTLLMADPSAATLSDSDTKHAAYVQAVELAMEYCRPQAELASHYFNEPPRAIYLDAKKTCATLAEKRIKADVVAVIDGGTRLVKNARVGDRGTRKAQRDIPFRSYTARYEASRLEGLSHEATLVKLEGLTSL
ncbi:MAG: hypothetical protein P4L84_13295 [Isosphaeraceae bacterium]|nr:hypothetical protein [Isosphaeraceae bacterium]